jgi:tetratricopeptide (TPR) repeat protein
MPNSRGLDPGELKLHTNYRSIVYHISHFIGPSRPYQFFQSYGGRLLILFFICIIVVLSGAYILTPHPAAGSTNNTPVVAVAGIMADDTTSGSTITTEGAIAGPIQENHTSDNQTPVSGQPEVPATGFSWGAILGDLTVSVSEKVQSAGSLVTGETVAAIFLLFFLGFVVSTGIQSRRQVLVGEFKNHISGDADVIGRFVGGVSPLLNVELHRLRRLYSEVDDRRAISSIGGRTGPLDYGITVGDAGDLLKNLYSSETKVKIGIIEIPFGAGGNLFSKIFSGPLIVGGFHQDGDLIILSAFMSGPESKSWRVEGRNTTTTPPQVEGGIKDISFSADDRPLIVSDKRVENLDGMVRELAYRIFTDLTKGGTTRWQATEAFTEGLQDYRSCLLSKKDQLRNLKNAERRFLEAISEDSTFGLAWHNLGVVYTELERLEASDKAFLKAIEIKPEERWEAYYALALNRFNKMIKTKRNVASDECFGIDEPILYDVIQPCKQAIALNPDNPRLHILLGVCYRLLAIQKRNSGSTGTEYESTEFFRKAAEEHSSAVNIAWHTLCLSQFKVEKSAIIRESDIRKASSTALWDLARTYYTHAVCGRNVGLEGKETVGYSLAPIESVLRQAISIDETNAVLWYDLGSVYYSQGKFPDAIRCFESASQIDPTNLKYWLLTALTTHQIALTTHQMGDVDKREFAIGKILELPSWMQGLPDSLKNKIKDLPLEGKCRDLRMILDFQEDKLRDPEKLSETFSNLFQDRKITWDNRGEFIDGSLFGAEKGISLPDPNAALVSYLAYHSAHYTEDKEKKREFYQKALEYLPKERSEEGWSQWARGIICAEVAPLSEDPFKDYQTCILCFKDNHPRELRTRGIQPKIIPLYQQANKNYEALRCASRTVYRNPIGFRELNSYGEFILSTGDITGAVSAFESALLREPYSVETLISLGDCYRILRDNSQTSAEKETFTKQAIRYYEEAREARKVKAFKKTHNDGQAGDHRAEEMITPAHKADEKLIRIAIRLGDLYYDLSEYGSAMLNYERGKDLSIYDESHFGDAYHCYLKFAEAALQKRDHKTCESYLSRLKNELEVTFPISETVSQLSDTWFISFEGAIVSAYLGEIYIRALLIQAYSFAERDIALDEAHKLIDKADDVRKKMWDWIMKEAPMNQVSEILDCISSLEAEILDRRGWVFYKQGKLTEAKESIKKALTLQADADYYFHLAHVYETLFRERSEKNEICARWALAFCDHALDMIPRPELIIEVKKLQDQITGSEKRTGK